MFALKQGLLGALALGCITLASGTALAASCNQPAQPFALGVVICGNDPFPDPLNGSPSLFKYEVDEERALNGIAGGTYTDDFTITFITSSSGTWKYDPSGPEDIGQLFPTLMVVKAGSDFVVFSVLGLLTGNWNTSLLGNKALSHISFYDGQTPNGGGGEVPLPGAVWLMGTVLAGGAGVGAWRRRRRAATQA